MKWNGEMAVNGVNVCEVTCFNFRTMFQVGGLQYRY